MRVHVTVTRHRQRRDPAPHRHETFTITVNDVNVAPVLAAIGNKTVNEQARC